LSKTGPAKHKKGASSYYEVEAVRNHRVVKEGKSNQIELLIKWKDYDDEENTWEQFKGFARDSPESLQRYLVAIDKKLKD
jgi:hypothetical protein